ncbi:tetratricopeptide repeat protein [Chitinophaga sp. RAB17]|uniref:tetratricopeptide repeat protein n=1 Tax=Chitinophaga sp. RAB17 TaxID=3233049 RepID=UPI003F934218
MNLFKKLFGKTAALSTPPAYSAEENFQQEFLATVPRYICKPGAPVNLSMKNPDTGKAMPFADAFPEQYATWKTVKSAADRRGIIYAILDQFMGSKLELWQLIERFTDDRYPEKALGLATTHQTAADEQSADYWSALAKTNFVLTNYAEASANASKAIALDPAHKRARIVLADTYHFIHQQEEAHRIYNEILAETLPKDKPLELSVYELLGFDGNILPSPIYAAAWLKDDINVTEEVWNWAGEEFYYSPQFRCQHAYYLIEKKEHLKGFVKLFNLAKDMPWCREAVMNSYSLIDQLGLGDRFSEEKNMLKALMDKNSWTNE